MTVVYDDLLEAARRIEGLVHRTPVMTSEKLNQLSGVELIFKCEHLQKVGAFKARGAINSVFSIRENVLKQGVATHSSGNHGAALARAAALRGIPAHIVVPDNAPRVKQDAIREYGAQVVLCQPTLAAREATLAKIVSETGAQLVHPYNDDSVIAGQGTAVVELIEQVGDLDAIVVPVGGGGLLAGSCLAGTHHGVPVYAAEPVGADDAFRSIGDKALVTSHVPRTICDGLLTTLGSRNFEIIRHHVREILLVPDEATVTAMQLIWTRMKQIVEPSSAIVLAAVLGNRDRFAGQRVGLVLTGGNVDLKKLPFSPSA